MKRSRPAAVFQLATLLRGTVIDSASRDAVRVLADAVLGVDDTGCVAFVEDDHPEVLSESGELVLRDGTAVALEGVRQVTLPPRAFLCPGFVDTHTHAPQFAFAGLGYDLQLLEWLETYTFPSEAKFADLAYAAKVSENAVRRTLLAGTTSCVYFGTLHTDAAVLLGQTARRHGQRSFVGKVNMDRNSPDIYRETTEESIIETERFVKLMLAAASASPSAAAATAGSKGKASQHSSGSPQSSIPDHSSPAMKGPPSLPVITPRFVPTCTSELMTALAQTAKAHGGLLIQSHVSENRGEIAWVKELHPSDPSYTHVYDSHGLLGPKTILAHGVYLEATERGLMRARGATVAHCPMSNSQIRSGMLNVRRLLNEKVHVSLGTDVSGGASPSMLASIRETLKVSNMVSVYEGDGTEFPPLTFSEAYWLATCGGAWALGVENLTGNLSPGSLFDALVIDPDAEGSPIDLYEGDTALEAFQKWLQLGDDRNTASIYVHGKHVYARE